MFLKRGRLPYQTSRLCHFPETAILEHLRGTLAMSMTRITRYLPVWSFRHGCRIATTPRRRTRQYRVRVRAGVCPIRKRFLGIIWSDGCVSDQEAQPETAHGPLSRIPMAIRLWRICLLHRQGLSAPVCCRSQRSGALRHLCCIRSIP